MKRVSLRKITLADRKYFARWWRDPEMLALTSGGKPVTDKELDRFLTALVKGSRGGSVAMITVSGRAIGTVGVSARAGAWREMHVAIGEKTQWGKGYGTRATLTMLRRAARAGAKKFFLHVRPRNLRAIRSYEKCGFIPAGRAPKGLRRMELRLPA